MPNTQSPADLAKRIQELLEEREQHAQALARIDATLERVGAALSPNVAGAVGRLAKAPNGQTGVPKAPGKRRRGPGSFPTTAGEAVISYVRQNKSPTTQEIEKHWTKEGRRGTAANTLTKLVKDKKLKREPLEGQRGSRYVLA